MLKFFSSVGVIFTHPLRKNNKSLIRKAEEICSQSSLSNSNSTKLIDTDTENYDNLDIKDPDSMDIASHEGKTKRSKGRP